MIINVIGINIMRSCQISTKVNLIPSFITLIILVSTETGKFNYRDIQCKESTDIYTNNNVLKIYYCPWLF